LRILIAEDDRELAEYLSRVLEEDHNQVTVAFDGLTALRAATREPFDALVVDVMLPQMDGFELTEKLRRNGNKTPILLLTARDDPKDIVRGLDSGADDYLTKPFSFDVLLARLRARTRHDDVRNSELRFADLTLNADTHEAWRGSEALRLTRKEFAILECLIRSGGRVVTRQRMIDTVWGGEREVGNNTLDAFMKLLRAKVDSGGLPRVVQTVRGIGYVLREDCDAG
jgi:two-component system response regulator MprA